MVLSVPHPLAPRTLRQREMAWYQLFFQFEGIAEAWLQHDDWALLRELSRGNGDIDIRRPCNGSAADGLSTLSESPLNLIDGHDGNEKGSIQEVTSKVIHRQQVQPAR